MPYHFVISLTSIHRSKQADYHLGLLLSLVAGAINAGGFLAVGQYTSHMTGLVSSMADNLVLGSLKTVYSALAGVLSFLLGAMCCTFMVHFARKRQVKTEYAFPLLLEALLLLVFGLLGSQIQSIHSLIVPLTVILLCFLMGLQNALITKISGAVIRTTHVTGLLTDLGIELGKMAYINHTHSEKSPRVGADLDKLKRLTGLLLGFFAGGLTGAWGFKHHGFSMVLPFALLLAVIGLAGFISREQSPQ